MWRSLTAVARDLADLLRTVARAEHVLVYASRPDSVCVDPDHDRSDARLLSRGVGPGAR